MIEIQPRPALEKYAVKTTKQIIEQWPSVTGKRTLNMSERRLVCMLVKNV